MYGAPLSWEQLPDRSAFRVADYSEGDITDVAEYAFYIDWMIDAQERLRRAVNSVLQTGDPPEDDFDAALHPPARPVAASPRRPPSRRLQLPGRQAARTR